MKNTFFPLSFFRGGAIAILLMPMSVLLTAQSNFFTTYPSNQVVMSAAGWDRYAHYSNSDLTDDTKIITTGDVRMLQNDGILRFMLPGVPDTLEAEAIRIEENSRVGFVWFGELKGQTGNLYLQYKNSQVNGYVQVDFRRYDIVHAENGYQFLLDRGLTDQTPIDCGLPGNGTSNGFPDPPGPNCTETNDNCSAIISILMVVSSAAQDFMIKEYGSVANYAMLNEQMTNTAFVNSDIKNKKVRVYNIVKDIVFDPDPTKIDQDIDIVRNSTLAERAQYKADIVIYVPLAYRPGIGGIVNAIPSDDFNAFIHGYAIAQAELNFDHLIFQHELGHLLGCRHNRPITFGDDGNGKCEHGYRFTKVNIEPTNISLGEIGGWKTIVSIGVFQNLPVGPGFPGIPPGGYSFVNNTILHYSNPKVSYQGEPTGVTESAKGAYNADQIRKSACIVDDYEQSTVFDMIVQYEPSGNCSAATIFTANITVPDNGLPGFGPYNVTWHWNYSGIFDQNNTNATLIGTGTVLTLSNYPACPIFWLKCTVVSADGITLSEIIRIEIKSNNPISDCYCDDPLPRNKSGSGLNMANSYPNPIPAGGTLHLPDGAQWIEVLDVQCRVLISQSVPQSGVLTIPNYINNGIYFLRSKIYDRMYTQKLLIQNK